MPTTFEENMEHYLMVSSALRDIRRRVAVDLEEVPSILSSAQRNRSRQSSKNMN